MKKELSLKQALAVQCPTCGVAPGELCERTKDWPTAHRSAQRPPIDPQRTIVGPWPFRAPWVYCFGHFLNRHLCDAVLIAFCMMKMQRGVGVGECGGHP